MPDIFGREPADYKHLQRIHDANLSPQEYLSTRARDSAVPVHDFNALGSFYGGRVQDTELNTQASGYLTNNLQAIQSMIEEILYVEFRLDDFVPIIENVPEGATTYAYRVVDRVGQGRFIDTGGSDAPSATVSQRLVPYQLEYAGIIPEWNFEDLRRAMFSGVPLDTETIRAAVEGAMDHIEQVGLNGDSERGFQGLLKHDQIGVSSGTAFTSMTPDEILRWLQNRTVEVITRTKEVFGRTIRNGLCFYLPISQASVLTTTRIPQGNDLNIWNYFIVNNAWVNYTNERIQLKWVQELDGGAANNTDDRMLIGFKNERVMEMAMPFAPRTTNTLTKAYSVCAPMEYKISGLNVKRPTAMQYYDGI